MIKEDDTMKFLIAAGGTGGHIIPGIAIANSLKQDGHEIIFVGTESGMEKDLVPNSEYDLKIIHASGLSKGFKNRAMAIVNLNKGIKECVELIKTEQPDAVIGTGGYVTAPLIIAGQKLKIPNFIHESNALPGKTTKLLCKDTTKTMLGFSASIKLLNNKNNNLIVTGNPNKMGENSLSKDEAKKEIGIEGNLLLITGGSQGAKKINETITSIIKNQLFGDYNVIYATGPKNYEEVSSKIIELAKDAYDLDVKEDEIIISKTNHSLSIGSREDDGVSIKSFSNNPYKIIIKKFIYNMEVVMKATDLMIARSGALTCSEIIECKVPAILIPFPYAAENHQYFNAKTIEDAGAGIIIEEKDLNDKVLADKINELMKDVDRLNEMSGNTVKLKTGNALKSIKDVIYENLSNK